MRLALPALGALAAEPIYILKDTAVVGHLGTPQLGGLAVAGTLLTTGFWLFNFLSYGTTASVARSVGAGDLAGDVRERGVDSFEPRRRRVVPLDDERDLGRPGLGLGGRHPQDGTGRSAAASGRSDRT